MKDRMRGFIISILLQAILAGWVSVLSGQYACADGEFEWAGMKGACPQDYKAEYGRRGVSDPANIPA